MKFVVKQAAEAVAEKPVELSIETPDGAGWAWVKANGSVILAFTPDGTVALAYLGARDRDLGFVAEIDGLLKVRNRTPC